jgi:hypothetical protein
MRQFPTIISFYTQNTPYEAEAENLAISCQRWNLDHYIKAIPSFGSWELNCAFKPFFILGELMERKEPLLWVDCDGVFEKAPQWIESFEADLSVRCHEDLPKDHPSRIISSTVYVNHTPEAEQLLRSWAVHAKQMLLDEEREEEFWDQMALCRAIQNHTDINVSPLPLAYAKIFDHPQDLIREPNPVIVHYQASRRFKHQVSTEYENYPS